MKRMRLGIDKLWVPVFSIRCYENGAPVVKRGADNFAADRFVGITQKSVLSGISTKRRSWAESFDRNDLRRLTTQLSKPSHERTPCLKAELLAANLFKLPLKLQEQR
jgi:hypothetical protein